MELDAIRDHAVTITLYPNEVLMLADGLKALRNYDVSPYNTSDEIHTAVAATRAMLEAAGLACCALELAEFSHAGEYTLEKFRRGTVGFSDQHEASHNAEAEAGRLLYTLEPDQQQAFLAQLRDASQAAISAREQAEATLTDDERQMITAWRHSGLSEHQRRGLLSMFRETAGRKGA